ncbi:MAG: LLM class F420-dependent oxidoreductase [Acidimicrobiia bacterium]
MKLAVGIPPAGTSVKDALDFIKGAESLGVGTVWVPEAYGTDAATQLGYLAAVTERIELGSGIMQIPARTPTMTAMTAATLDLLSGGRFVLGLGVSGPQVAEGWYGTPFTKPLLRTREYVEILRKIWDRKERLTFEGEAYSIPTRGGMGLGKPLKLMFQPPRRIPVYIAAMGPKNVALTAEIADGWLPAFYSPDRADVFKPYLEEGFKRGNRNPADLDIVAPAFVSVARDFSVEAARSVAKAMLSFYAGGMGAKEANFYNDLLKRYGYSKEAEQIQELFLAGKRAEAAQAVPDELVDSMGLWGNDSRVAERLSKYSEAGVTTLQLNVVAGDTSARLSQIETVLRIGESL